MRRIQDFAKGEKAEGMQGCRMRGYLTEEPKCDADTWLGAAEELGEVGAIHGPRCGRCEWEREHSGCKCICLLEELIASEARDPPSFHGGDWS